MGGGLSDLGMGIWGCGDVEGGMEGGGLVMSSDFWQFCPSHRIQESIKSVPINRISVRCLISF